MRKLSALALLSGLAFGCAEAPKPAAPPVVTPTPGAHAAHGGAMTNTPTPAEGEAPKTEGEAPKAEGEAPKAEGEAPKTEGETSAPVEKKE